MHVEGYSDFCHYLSGWHRSVFRRVVFISSQSLNIRRPPLSSKTRRLNIYRVPHTLVCVYPSLIDDCRTLKCAAPMLFWDFETASSDRGATKNARILFTWLVENSRIKSHVMCYKHLVGASRRLALRHQMQPYRGVTRRVIPTQDMLCQIKSYKGESRGMESCSHFSEHPGMLEYC